MTQIPEPPQSPAYAQPIPPVPQAAPRSVTITFPTIHGKLAAVLYTFTLLFLGAIAWAQIDQALTAREGHELYIHQACSGTVYGGEDYTAAERAKFEELCDRPLQVDED